MSYPSKNKTRLMASTSTKGENKQIHLNYNNSLSVIKSCLYIVLSSDRHTL